MAEGRSDDFEIQDLGEKYPENDMSLDKLNERYDLLSQRMSIINNEILNDDFSNHAELVDIKIRMTYIDELRKKILNRMEISFIDSDDGNTVNIINKNNDTQVEAPGVKFNENVGNYSDLEQQNFDLAFKD